MYIYWGGAIQIDIHCRFGIVINSWKIFGTELIHVIHLKCRGPSPRVTGDPFWGPLPTTRPATPINISSDRWPFFLLEIGPGPPTRPCTGIGSKNFLCKLGLKVSLSFSPFIIRREFINFKVILSLTWSWRWPRIVDVIHYVHCRWDIGDRKQYQNHTKFMQIR